MLPPTTPADHQEVNGWSNFIWIWVNERRVVYVHESYWLKVSRLTREDSSASGETKIANQARVSAVLARARYNKTPRGSHPLNGLNKVQTRIEVRNARICIGIPSSLRKVNSRAHYCEAVLQEFGLLV
jgi:hypothetical protein